MARIDITLAGRLYPIACADGEEPRVRELAGWLDARLAEIRGSARSASDAQLLVMLALLLGDELQEARSREDESLEDAEDREALADAVGRLADRVNAIAGRLSHD